MTSDNESKVKVEGTVETVEMELVFLLTSIYDIDPESIKTAIHLLIKYMDDEIELKRTEVYDDSF